MENARQFLEPDTRYSTVMEERDWSSPALPSVGKAIMSVPDRNRYILAIMEENV